MAPFLIPIVAMLAEKGMGAVATLIEGGADKAVDLIAEKTGIDLTKSPKLTPEQEASLRDYDLQLKRLDLEREQSYLNDVGNARAMQMSALSQSDVWSKRFVYIFAAAWSIFACGYIGAITFYPIPTGSERFADTILGFLLGTVIGSILNFFFGSSMGSKQKTEIINKS